MTQQRITVEQNLTGETKEAKLYIMHTRQGTITIKQETNTETGTETHKIYKLEKRKNHHGDENDFHRKQ